jgi:hypothetical protein
MTGRHAAPPDDAFDQRERERVGSHRADVEVPLGPDDVAATPVAAPADPAKPARARKAAAKTTPSTTSKRASTP